VRFKSSIPSIPRSQKRFRQRPTDLRVIPSRSPISVLVAPSAAISTIFARSTSR
jgi:hypothetical protein